MSRLQLATLGAFISGTAWKRARGPRDAAIDSQIPGAAAAGDLSELISPLFSRAQPRSGLNCRLAAGPAGTHGANYPRARD